MLRLLLDAARGCGIPQLRLAVDSTNRRAIALYEDVGFRRVGDSADPLFFTCDLPLQPSSPVVSSMAFSPAPAEEMIETAARGDLALEFSSGLPHRGDMEALFLQAPVVRFAHNYFPAPEEPFVLNLASGNPHLRERSVRHCVRGVELSHQVGAPFFSVHAGFCVDPAPADLGRSLPVAHVDREAGWSRFTASIREILDETYHLPPGLLVENHVLSRTNLPAPGESPVFCVEAAEQLRLLSEIDDARLGLLCDTGHLKVSATTLQRNVHDEVEPLLPHVRCVHHSDNDGMSDDNGPIDGDYWFLPYLADTHAVHVLEVRATGMTDLVRMARWLEAKHARWTGSGPADKMDARPGRLT